MSLVFERPVDGPAVHALVIGVGSYPFAKPAYADHYTPSALLHLPDLPNACAGARLFTDWLLGFADRLPAPLASIELLMSDPGTMGWGSTYTWPSDVPIEGTDPRHDDHVAPARQAEVEKAGLEWSQRLADGPHDNFAILYICGHGAAMPTQSIIFLEDLNGLPARHSRWEPFIDLHGLSAALKRTPCIETAYLMVDACQTVDQTLVLAHSDPVNAPRGLRFFAGEANVRRENTFLLVPGPMGSAAFADGLEAGRFTQVLVDALSGAAARDNSGQGSWSIMVETLPQKMKQLAALTWADAQMTPVPVSQPISDLPLVAFPAGAPEVPFRIAFDPHAAMTAASKVWIDDSMSTQLIMKTCQSPRWMGRVRAQRGLCTINAAFPPNAQSYKDSHSPFDLSEMRLELVHRVPR